MAGVAKRGRGRPRGRARGRGRGGWKRLSSERSASRAEGSESDDPASEPSQPKEARLDLDIVRSDEPNCDDKSTYGECKADEESKTGAEEDEGRKAEADDKKTTEADDKKTTEAGDKKTAEADEKETADTDEEETAEADDSCKRGKENDNNIETVDNTCGNAADDNGETTANDTHASVTADKTDRQSDKSKSKSDNEAEHSNNMGITNGVTRNSVVLSRDDLSGFRFVDINLLVSFISRFPCPSCHKPNLGYPDPQLTAVRERSTGSASVLEFTCGSCGESQTMNSSAKAGPSYEVNSRFHAAMFTIGNNDNKAKRFCSTMKMPEPQPFKPWMNKHA